ncbi:CMRF35-like molecule 4 [Esox lucius]|uniref:CMRF35-like molecule 3 n=1 Tax=Esox lucius TaxID=8010 RepID=C1BYB7_ESOLU|nr:CMRF35-like molecule 4 [Esox lucius]ACO14020.1 CMRF35-like molecule 3 precursor [Esox lucius]
MMRESRHETENMMRRFISVSHVLLCAGVCVTSEVITGRGREGGSTSIECPYDQGWETYTKYFCKGIWAHKVPVIQSNQPSSWTSNGRYSLFDDRKRRVFTVIISNLTLQDTDTYWCFIDGWGSDHQTEVNLTVDQESSPTPSRPILMATDSSHSATGLVLIGNLLYSGVGLVLVLLLLGLLLFIFFRKRRQRAKRSTVSKNSARTLVPDSTIANQDPHLVSNPTYCTETNQNPDTHDIMTDYATSTSQHPDLNIYSNIDSSTVAQSSVNYDPVNLPMDPSYLHYAVVSFSKDSDSLDLPDPQHSTADVSLMYSAINHFKM